MGFSRQTILPGNFNRPIQKTGARKERGSVSRSNARIGEGQHFVRQLPGWQRCCESRTRAPGIAASPRRIPVDIRFLTSDSESVPFRPGLLQRCPTGRVVLLRFVFTLKPRKRGDPGCRAPRQQRCPVFVSRAVSARNVGIRREKILTYCDARVTPSGNGTGFLFQTDF